jgi:hypothetical protein
MLPPGRNRECALWETCHSFVSISHAGDHFATRMRSFIALLLLHPITNVFFLKGMYVCVVVPIPVTRGSIGRECRSTAQHLVADSAHGGVLSNLLQLRAKPVRRQRLILWGPETACSLKAFLSLSLPLSAST